MTFYDDAELAAVEATRLAVAEWEGAPNSKGIHDLTMRLYAQHGSDGIAGLVVALARQNATALSVVATQRGVPISDLIDSFELHKLEQHDLEREDEE